MVQDTLLGFPAGFFISFQGAQGLSPYAENSRRGVSVAAVPVIQFSVTPRLRCRS